MGKHKAKHFKKVVPEPIDIGDRVELHWFDAHGGGSRSWITTDEIKTTPNEIVSVGQVLENNEDAITIVQSVDMHSGYVDNHLLVPWVNVRVVNVL